MKRALTLITLASIALGGCVSQKRQGRADARVALGVAYFNEGSNELAILTLQEATDLDRRNVDAWHWLAMSLMKRGEIEQAEEAFLRALKLDPDAAEPNLNYAFLLQKTGRDELAVGYLERARGDLGYREPAKILNNLGIAYYELENYQMAAARLQEAVTRAPNYCVAWFHLGLTYEAEARTDPALEAYERVILLCPEEAAGSYLHAGQLLADAGECEVALSYLEEALRIPDLPNAVIDEIRSSRERCR